MNTFDSQKATRVWQRVQNQSPPTQEHGASDDFQPLIVAELEFASLCMRLSTQADRKKAAVLQKLGRSARDRAACLRGMCTLVRGEAPQVRVVGGGNAAPGRGLQRCCMDIQKQLHAYESRRDDPRYGCVYDRFCRQLQDELCLVLELIGGAGK